MLAFILTGKGVPDKRMEENKKTFTLPSIDMLPTGEEAVLAYEREDGHLSLPEVFGTEFLSGNQQLQKLRFAGLKVSDQLVAHATRYLIVRLKIHV